MNARKTTWAMLLVALLAVLLTAAPQAGGQTAEPPVPGFSKVFTPDEIGPGSVSTLVFTISNTEGATPVTSLEFTDTLPSAPEQLTIATPANASTTCIGGELSAPSGGTSISYIDGGVGAGQSCTVSVDVTASTIGTYQNLSGDLTSSAGNSGTAADDLMVSGSQPGFSKSFFPSTIARGARSTLTFTIDNSNGDTITSLSFDDTLPAGVTIAAPSNASTTCGTPPTTTLTLTAAPGSSSITFSVFSASASFPALAAESTCAVSVDVVGTAVGPLTNVSEPLQVDGAPTTRASATLTVTGVDTPLELTKEFIDDPVPPGGTVTLEFSVTNRSREEAATAVTFDDDLDEALTGLAPTGPLPADPCGTGSSLEFDAGVLTLTDGSLGPGETCTFSIALAVPVDAAPSSYSNETSAVEGVIAGEPVTGNVAGDLLFIVSYPVLTKEFTDDPVGAGGTVTLEFTITNPGTLAMSDIEFIDQFTFLPAPISAALPSTPCGAGSSVSLVEIGFDGLDGIELTGGALAAAGTAGDSCTFSLVLDIPDGFPSGTYTNTTGEISATVPDGNGGMTVTGPGASDDIFVAGAPRLTKEFTDDPVVPGGTVTLVFSIENTDTENAATAIAFGDDLDATLSGLTLLSEDVNTCGGTLSGISTGLLSYSGGSLAADTVCTVEVTLTVPTDVSGIFTNVTTPITATVVGVPVTGNAASDDLAVSGLLFSKEFTDDPVVPGDFVTLVFTLDNTSGTTNATDISFSDNLDAVVSGLQAVGAISNGCNGMAVGTFPTGSFSYSGGSVDAGDSCTVVLELQVPFSAPDGEYGNTTSNLIATIGQAQVVLPPANDTLVVDSNLLQITKEFTDDPVAPGDNVTLEFTLTNLSGTQTVNEIAFDDDLDAALTGLTAEGPLLNECGGSAIGMPAAFPTTHFFYGGGTLAPGATCTIRLDLTVPNPLPTGESSPFINTTSQVAGTVGDGLEVTGDPASDELIVRTVTFAKSFDGPTTATGQPTLTFTIDNGDPNNAVTGVAFSDNLSAMIPGLVAVGLPVPACGGTVSGTSFVTLTNATLPAGGSCIFSITLSVPSSAAAVSYLNTTSSLSSSGLTIAGPATDTLVVEPPPLFSKAFDPTTIVAGATSTLTFTVDNSASSVVANDLTFTDDLPANVLVAATPNVGGTCGGATIATPGSATITHSGGGVDAGISCTMSVDVTSAVADEYLNTTSTLTSTSGTSGSASATLTVTGAPEPISDLSITKTDSADPVFAGSPLVYTITVSNAGPDTAADVAVTDLLPAGVNFVSTAGCAEDPAGVPTCTLGDIPAGESRQYTVNTVVAPATIGTISNTASINAPGSNGAPFVESLLPEGIRVYSASVDPNPGNNSVTETTLVLAPPGGTGGGPVGSGEIPDRSPMPTFPPKGVEQPAQPPTAQPPTAHPPIALTGSETSTPLAIALGLLGLGMYALGARRGINASAAGRRSGNRHPER